MIVQAPPLTSGGPIRALVLKKWIKLSIQVLGANTLFIGTSKDEAGRTAIAGVQDGVQLNSANATIPFEIWWIGELWVSGSGLGCVAVIIAPGLQPSLFEAGGGQCESTGE